MPCNLFALSLISMSLSTQISPRPILSLWPKGNPDGWSRSDKETSENQNGNLLLVKSVSSPTLEVFASKSARPNSPTVLVLPGGGYYVEAIEHEGWEIATRLNLAGFNAAVLKYRLPNHDKDKPLHQVVLQDAQRAIRLLRSQSSSLHLASDHVGLLGFSAGGHATAVTSTTAKGAYEPQDEADKANPRPDFTVLIYPAYLNLEGTTNLVDSVKIDEHTPPAFVVQAMDDPIPIEGALAYTHACHVNKVPIELHLFPHGGHGYGLRTQEPGLETWPDLLIAWLKRLK